MTTATESIHLLQDEFLGVNGMRGFYERAKMLPTSSNADIALIRSHIAYWGGSIAAARASIRPSRGHSYRVAEYGDHGSDDLIVRIVDHYDHREGVRGYCTAPGADRFAY